jgi:hypothetical protein
VTLVTYEYADVTALLNRLMQSAGGAVTSMDLRPAVQRRVRAASARINAACGRVFTPTTLTRALDVPDPAPYHPNYRAFAGGWGGWESAAGLLHGGWGRGWIEAQATLPVPDLQTVTSVTAFGTVLVAGTDYQILRYPTATGAPGTTALLRLRDGSPVPWRPTGAAPWQPLQAVVVAGIFCYDPDDVPAEITAVCEALVLKDWARYVRSYAAGAGTTAVDDLTLDADLQARLVPYTLPADPVLFA